jgi:excisionase family DNA binding protein
METFTIREAAERCELSYQALRRRVDRGTVQTVMKGGARRIPRGELERVGLWPGAQPGAPAEVQRLQHELDVAHQELRKLRLLPREVDAEREARDRVEAALHEERAERQAAQAAREALEAELRAAEEASAKLKQVAWAGFWERRRLLRALRTQSAA